MFQTFLANILKRLSNRLQHTWFQNRNFMPFKRLAGSIQPRPLPSSFNVCPRCRTALSQDGIMYTNLQTFNSFLGRLFILGSPPEGLAKGLLELVTSFYFDALKWELLELHVVVRHLPKLSTSSYNSVAERREN